MCWTPGLSFINILFPAGVTPLSHPIFLSTRQRRWAPLCSLIFHLSPLFPPPLILPSLLLTQLPFVVDAGDKDTRRLQLRTTAGAKSRRRASPPVAVSICGAFSSGGCQFKEIRHFRLENRSLSVSHVSLIWFWTQRCRDFIVLHLH